jgi:hypothetical protein
VPPGNQFHFAAFCFHLHYQRSLLFNGPFAPSLDPCNDFDVGHTDLRLELQKESPAIQSIDGPRASRYTSDARRLPTQRRCAIADGSFSTIRPEEASSIPRVLAIDDRAWRRAWFGIGHFCVTNGDRRKPPVCEGRMADFGWTDGRAEAAVDLPLGQAR